MIENYFELLKNKIPKKSKIILYIRLKGLVKDNNNQNIDYKILTKNILNMIREYFSPSEIFVPTFSYSFLKNGLFDIYSTPSNVGRFSEEIRIMFKEKNYRTKDPVFSIVETEKGLFNNSQVNVDAFGKQSVWKYLNDNEHYIININLNLPIVLTQLHFLEYENKIQYRYLKNFYGSFTDWNKIDHKIKYTFYVRNIKTNPLWNREKLFKICKDNNIVLEEGPIKIFKWLKLLNILKQKLSDNSNFLIL